MKWLYLLTIFTKKTELILPVVSEANTAKDNQSPVTKLSTTNNTGEKEVGVSGEEVLPAYEKKEALLKNTKNSVLMGF